MLTHPPGHRNLPRILQHSSFPAQELSRLPAPDLAAYPPAGPLLGCPTPSPLAGFLIPAASLSPSPGLPGCQALWPCNWTTANETWTEVMDATSQACPAKLPEHSLLPHWHSYIQGNLEALVEGGRASVSLQPHFPPSALRLPQEPTSFDLS